MIAVMLLHCISLQREDVQRRPYRPFDRGIPRADCLRIQPSTLSRRLILTERHTKRFLERPPGPIVRCSVGLITHTFSCRVRYQTYQPSGTPLPISLAGVDCLGFGRCDRLLFF